MRSITGFDYAHDYMETPNNDGEEDEQHTDKEVSNFNFDVKFGQERLR